MAQSKGSGTVCYDAVFDPFGGEHGYTNNCPSSSAYKFEGKERDTETGNDDFGARYYSARFGRWLSADWSSVPVAVPYANLTNPQTLNLYAMVADDPETAADLEGHTQNASQGTEPGERGGPTCAANGQGGSGSADSGKCGANQTAKQTQDQQQANEAKEQAKAISFSVQIENVGGQANPKEPVTLGSGTVFAVSVTYKGDLPSGTTVRVDVAVKDASGKPVSGSEVMYSIETKTEVGTKVGGKTVTALENTFEIKGIVLSKNGAFKPTESASLAINLADKAAHREGSTSISAKLSGAGEGVDRKQAAKFWQGSRSFQVP